MRAALAAETRELRSVARHYGPRALSLLPELPPFVAIALFTVGFCVAAAGFGTGG